MNRSDVLVGALFALLVATLLPTSAAAFTRTTTSTCSGVACTVTASMTGLPPATGNITVRVGVRGDFSHFTEYVHVFVDGQDTGDVCESGCSDCSGSYQGFQNFTVPASAISDGRLDFELRSNSNDINICTPQIDAQITVTYTTNQPPTASNQSVSLAEDTSRSVTLSASDPDGDPLNYTIISGPPTARGPAAARRGPTSRTRTSTARTPSVIRSTTATGEPTRPPSR